MKEPDGEGLASHPGPESCAGRREAAGEALTAGSVGPVLSCEIKEFGVPMSFRKQKATPVTALIASRGRTPRSQRPGACVDVLCRNLGDPGDARCRTADRAGRGRRVAATLDMHVVGKSDDCVVPMKAANEAVRAVEESLEGRRSTKGNDMRSAAPRTQRRTRASIKPCGVRAEGPRSDRYAITRGRSRVR